MHIVFSLICQEKIRPFFSVCIASIELHDRSFRFRFETSSMLKNRQIESYTHRLFYTFFSLLFSCVCVCLSRVYFCLILIFLDVCNAISNGKMEFQLWNNSIYKSISNSPIRVMIHSVRRLKPVCNTVHRFNRFSIYYIDNNARQCYR